MYVCSNVIFNICFSAMSFLFMGPFSFGIVLNGYRKKMIIFSLKGPFSMNWVFVCFNSKFQQKSKYICFCFCFFFSILLGFCLIIWDIENLNIFFLLHVNSHIFLPKISEMALIT